MNKKRKFVFIDLEMTGLSHENDVILEAALIITDSECNQLHEGVSFVIWQPETTLEKMNEWCKETHTKSGLVQNVRTSNVDTLTVQNAFLQLIQQFAPNQTGILAGNSVWQDRLFLARFMPPILSALHYRILDVSSIKEIFNAWKKNDQKEFKKKESHRALSDIRESIEELRYYKQNMFM